jgi:uncharacterized protein YcfL
MQMRDKNGIILLLFLLLAGCKSARQVTTVDIGSAKETNVFFDSMNEQAFTFQTLSARTSMEIQTSKNELSSRVDIKIVKDSAIQLSAQPLLGIEAFRLELSVDSIKVIDRLNKQYVLESYAGLKGRIPVDFNFFNLQALFTNRLFVPGEKEITPRQYRRFKLRQDGVVAEAQIQDAKLLYTFRADGEEKLLSTRITDVSEAYTLQCLYTDFRLTEGRPFPMLMDMSLLIDREEVMRIKTHFSRIQKDVPLNIDFSIPEKYKRVTFQDMIKRISGSK